jgi:hypothetical protein
VEIIPPGFGDAKALTFKYASGVVVTQEPFDEEMTKGVKFIGEKGWIAVARGYFKASDPAWVPENKEEGGRYETKVSHQENFITSIRDRVDPTVPVETGHRSCTVCNLGNIAYELKRPVKWNPDTEQFVDDPEAEKMFHRVYREGYSL